METYTNEEKEMLLVGLDYYIDDDRINSRRLSGPYKKPHMFHNDGKHLQLIQKFRELRIKLILEIAPIEIKKSKNQDEQSCILCEKMITPGASDWAYVEDKPICHTCFKTHKPQAYERAARV